LRPFHTQPVSVKVANHEWAPIFFLMAQYVPKYAGPAKNRKNMMIQMDVPVVRNLAKEKLTVKNRLAVKIINGPKVNAGKNLNVFIICTIT